MPSEIKSLLDNPAQTILVVLCLYIVIRWGAKQFKEIKTWWDDKMEAYYTKKTSQNEEKEQVQEQIKSINENLQSQIDTMNDKLTADYTRIQKSESHLYQLQEDVKTLSSTVTSMDDALTDLRVKQMRSFILNAVGKCIDMQHPVSLEYYENVENVFKDYEELITAKGLENDQVNFSMRMIRDSRLRRAEAGSYTDQMYIAPDKHKLQATAEYHPSWWEQEDKDEKKEK